MLTVLGAPCLSEHICTSAGQTFLQCLSFLCSVLLLILRPQTLWNIMLLMENLIKTSHLVFFLTSLSQRFGLCVSVVHTTASFFFFSEYNRVTKCLEWRFTTFIDLDFKPLVCFEECINQRNWHQQAFHWVQKKRAPLKIARELL